MAELSAWKIPAFGFKIKSKKDVETFLNDSLIPLHRYYFLIDKTTVCFIDKYDEDTYKVSLKYGDLLDVFNPEIVIDGSESIGFLYKHRRLINEKFFS